MKLNKFRMRGSGSDTTGSHIFVNSTELMRPAWRCGVSLFIASCGVSNE
jgi:hypothetical protein